MVEVSSPSLSADHRAAMTRMWDDAVRTNPSLFDGPAAVCAGLNRAREHLVLTWARTTYRHHALRRVPGAPWLPSLFVAVLQPTVDGCLLVARGSTSTVAPGRWQLPGGSIEPPADHQLLDEATLRREAARELVEETGLDTRPDDLTLWLVTREEDGNVGFLFLAPPRPAALVHRRFTGLVSAEAALGRTPELDQIALVRSESELACLHGSQADYLEPVVRRYAFTMTRPHAPLRTSSTDLVCRP